MGQCRIRADIWPHDPQAANRHRCGNRVPLGIVEGVIDTVVDKQFASVNNVPPEPWTGQDTRDRGMRCLIAPRFLALSSAWYAKEQATFSDALAAVRQHLWKVEYFSTSTPDTEWVEIPRVYLQGLMQSACYTH